MRLFALFAVVILGFGTAASGQGVLTTFGDSITHGVFVSHDDAYAVRLARRYGMRLENRGMSGWTSCMMAADEVFAKSVPTRETGHLFSTMMIGTNDSNYGENSSYENLFQMCLRSSVTWLTIPAANKTLATSSDCVKSGSWHVDSTAPEAGLIGDHGGDSMTCKIKSDGGPVIVWFEANDQSKGRFVVNVDKMQARHVRVQPATQIRLPDGRGFRGAAQIVFEGLSAGDHEVQINVRGFWWMRTGAVKIFGVGTAPKINTAPHLFVGGVPYQRNDLKAETTKRYYALGQAVVRSLAEWGLPVSFVQTRSRLLGKAEDYVDDLHPNPQGHQLLEAAFADAISRERHVRK